MMELKIDAALDQDRSQHRIGILLSHRRKEASGLLVRLQFLQIEGRGLSSQSKVWRGIRAHSKYASDDAHVKNSTSRNLLRLGNYEGAKLRLEFDLID